MWSFGFGEDVGVPDAHGGKVWVGTTYDVGAGVSEGGMVAMPFDADALVALTRATATRSLNADECQLYLERPSSFPGSTSKAQTLVQQSIDDALAGG